MSAREKESAAEALERIKALENENRDLKRRIENLERLLPGRLEKPPSPQIRRPDVVPARPLPGVGPAPADSPEPPKAA